MNEKDLINLLKNILPVAGNLSIIISTGTLIHTIRKDTKQVNRDQAIATTNTNNEFVKTILPLIDTYNDKIETNIMDKITKVSYKYHLSNEMIQSNTTLYTNIILEASTELKLTTILNELETISQYSLYDIINNKLFYNSTYNHIIGFYIDNKDIITLVNNEKQTYNNFELLAKKKWLYTLKWGKWKVIKRLCKL